MAVVLALPHRVGAGGEASAWQERIGEWASGARLSVVECGGSAFDLAGACDRCLPGTLAPAEAQSLLAHLLGDEAPAAAPPLLLGTAHAAAPARPVARER